MIKLPWNVFYVRDAPKTEDVRWCFLFYLCNVNVIPLLPADAVVSMGMVQQLVSVLRAPHSPFHEHVLGALCWSERESTEFCLSTFISVLVSEFVLVSFVCPALRTTVLRGSKTAGIPLWGWRSYSGSASENSKEKKKVRQVLCQWIEWQNAKKVHIQYWIYEWIDIQRCHSHS